MDISSGLCEIISETKHHRGIAMKEFTAAFPFAFDAFSPDASIERHRLVERFPGSPDGMVLPNVATVCHSMTARLILHDVRPRPGPLPGVVPVALSSAADATSHRRAVLGLPMSASYRLIELALGRNPSAKRDLPDALTSGQKGVLLYVLDTAAGDWFAAGGCGFVIRSILAHEGLVASYLGSAPEWEVSGTLRLDDMTERVFLWTRSLSDEPSSVKGVSSSRCSEAEVALRVTLGSTQVPASDVNALEPEDLVVLDAWALPGSRRSSTFPLLRCGEWRGQARWLGTRHLEIISSEGLRETDITDERSVLLSVEVKGSRTPRGEAPALNLGEVVCLEGDVGSTVELTSGEHRLARGSLVRYEGGMAVLVREVT